MSSSLHEAIYNHLSMQAATVMIQSALPSIDTQLEERLRRASQTGRIRFSEFFKDFDPLKSGVITSRLPASSFARLNLLRLAQKCSFVDVWTSI